jgi:nicotinamidase-related amidase
MLPAPTRIDAARAVLLVIDLQERLAAVMPQVGRALVERNVATLLELARHLALPVVVSEQYPKGLGPTREPLRVAAADLPRVARLEKTTFACTDAPGWSAVREIVGPGRDQWIVVGMETHICVYQSVRGLRQGGAEVHVVRDAVISRQEANFLVGLGLIERTGAFVSSTETLVFDALGSAGSDAFKAMSRLVK